MANNENTEATDAQASNPVGENDQTAKIPRPGQQNNGKVVLKSSADSVIKPSDATRMAPAIPQPGATAKPPVAPAQPISPKTIKLKPVSDAVAEDQDAGETISVDRKDVVGNAAPNVANNDAAPLPAKPAKSKTIKLKPLRPPNAAAEDDQEMGETLSLSRDSLSEISNDSLTPSTSTFDDEATIKIQKPTTTKPSHPIPASTMPGSKETINLRPSSNTPPPPPSAPTVNLSGAEATGASPSASSGGKRTIRLVPKAAKENDSTQKPPKPSDPTVNLKEVAETPAPATPAPDDKTIKLDSPEATKPSAKRTLKLKPTGGPAPTPAPPTSEEDTQTGGETIDIQDDKSANTPIITGGSSDEGEPNVIFTLVAVVALGLLSYYAYLAGTQLMALNG